MLESNFALTCLRTRPSRDSPGSVTSKKRLKCDRLLELIVGYYTFALLTVCSSTNQRAITLFALLLSQSVSYYTFALFTCTRNTLSGIYCTVVNGA